MDKALKKRRPDDERPVAIVAEDEARFGRISEPRRCWAPKPIRPVVPRQVVHEWVYVFAAVCPKLGKISSLILPYANTDMMNLFFEQVSRDFSDYFVVMLTDKAGWHLSDRLKTVDNIILIHQPSHSPELNPSEHIWEDIREKELANKDHDSIDDLIDDLCLGINRLASDPDYLSSMTDFPYLRITL